MGIKNKIMSKNIKLNDCLQYILANPFDYHLVERKAKEALSILDEPEPAIPIQPSNEPLTEDQRELFHEIVKIVLKYETFNDAIPELKSKFNISRKPQ